jgi:hypothetical protein
LFPQLIKLGRTYFEIGSLYSLIRSGEQDPRYLLKRGRYGAPKNRKNEGIEGYMNVNVV